MSKFDYLQPPSVPPPVGEFDDLVRLTFSTEAPPHQVLSFCFNFVLAEPPGDLVREFAQPGSESPLETLASAFLERYCGGLIPRSRIEKLMTPLRDRLAMPLNGAISDRNSRRSCEHLLESQGDRVCGTTTLRLYHSGRLPAKLNDWVQTAERSIARRAPETEPERLACLFDGALMPFESMSYLLRVTGREPFDKIAVAYGEIPLSRLAGMVERMYFSQHVADVASTSCFRALEAALAQELGAVLPGDSKQARKQYEHLLKLAVAKTRLCDYATEVLAKDIAKWSWSVMRDVRRRFLAPPPARSQAGSGS
jgi:hypothetical protein